MDKNAFKQDLSHIEHWIFDLDNTIYHARYNLFCQVSKKITDYVMAALDLEREQAKQLQTQYFHGYGTTMRGMVVNHQCDPEEFLSFVHDIDYSKLPYDGELVKGLQNISGKKYIFTNGSKEHALCVLEQMQLVGFFDDIFDIRIADFIPKPFQEPYDSMLKMSSIDPKKSIMVEDISQNLKVPFALGMKTLWVEDSSEEGAGFGKPGEDTSYIDYHCDGLSDWLCKLY